ncbi:MAG: hypothetical protein UHX00_10510 [Caryophanon sp.]|nr:hypothetical protein [Caryophanon sp.]
MTASKERIMTSIQSISVLAVSTSSGAEQVYASAQEQLNSIRVVSEKARYLNIFVDQLRGEVDKFAL